MLLAREVLTLTFCLGIKVREGLVGIADTRVISGNENISARKVSLFNLDGHQVFFMTSGLRSVRDKAVAYFEEAMFEREESFDRLFKVANAFAGQIRRVAQEDKKTLEESGFNFNIYCLMGGRMANDAEHKLYLIYPQANWVEIGASTPYHIIGAAGYGKPVLDRTLKYEDSLRFALKVGCLAFDSTRISAADVDFPIDVVLYFADTNELVERRFEFDDLTEITEGWQERLRASVSNLPSRWLDSFFSEIGRAAMSSSETGVGR
jgi:putative proteasome-type protease